MGKVSFPSMSRLASRSIQVPGEVLGILRRRLWLIVLITMAVVGIAGWLVRRQASEYRSSAILRIVDGQSLRAETEALTGRTVLGAAVDREGLRLYSTATSAPTGLVEDVQVSLPPERSGTIRLAFEEERIVYGPPGDRRTARYGAPVALNGARFRVSSPPAEGSLTLRIVPRDTAIDYLRDRTLPIPDPSTGAIEVRFTSTEPGITSRSVNAIVESYQETSDEGVLESVRSRRASLEGELRTADSLLIVAQTGLRLLQAREQRAQLEAALRAHESALNGIFRARRSGRSGDLLSPGSIPAVVGDPVAGPLYSRLVADRREREGMLAGPSARPPQHPDVQRLSTLIAASEQSLVLALGGRIGSLRVQIEELDALQSRVSAEVGESSGTGDAGLVRRIEDLQRTAAGLRNQVQEAGLEEASETRPAEIVELSTRALPVRSIPWIELLLGLVVGLVVGAAAAVAGEAFRSRPRERRPIEKIEEVDEVLVPLLADIPAVTPYLVEPGANGDVRPNAREAAGIEAYGRLRANLLASRWGLRSLVITSAHPGEGKTTTSTNLAAAYARQGQKVVLVECDLRRPSLGRYFGISREIDLVDVLFENHDWRKALQTTRVPGLFVLLGEKSFPKAGDSLGGPEMKRLLAEISSEYDFVILDTSPLLVAADAVVLAPIVDGILIVVRETRTDRRTVDELVQRLRRAGGSVLGTVRNDPESGAS